MYFPASEFSTRLEKTKASMAKKNIEVLKKIKQCTVQWSVQTMPRSVPGAGPGGADRAATGPRPQLLSARPSARRPARCL